MVWGLVALGVASLIGAGISLWIWRKQKHELALMAATETTPAAEIAGLPVGTTVEVKGVIRCEAPIAGRYCEHLCAYSVATKERQYIYYQLQNGRRERRRGNEMVENLVRFAPFAVEDASGRIAVSAEGAKVEGIEVVSHYEDHVEQKQEGLAMAALRALSTNEQTLGFQYKESHLPLDAAVYVLGVKTADGGIGAGGGPFIISSKSEEARMASVAGSSKWSLSIGIACLAVALAFFAGALWTGRAAPPAAPAEAQAPAPDAVP